MEITLKESKILKEPALIAVEVQKIAGMVKRLREYDDDLKYADWSTSEFIDGLTESEDGMKLLRDGHEIAEYSDDPYFVNQWTGYCPDDYHGFMYFRTSIPGTYVKVYYEM